MLISFGVPSIPVAQPRQRQRVVSARGRTFSQNYTPRTHPVQDFKATVRLAASQAYSGPPLKGALSVVLVFVLPRPGRLMWKTRPMPRVWHDKKPDIDNLIKSLFDSLRLVLWRDDSQIAVCTVKKVYAAASEIPGVSVQVETMGDNYGAVENGFRQGNFACVQERR